MIKNNCLEASPFMVIQDSEKNILVQYGTRERGMNELSQIKGNAIDNWVLDWKLFGYVAVGFLLLGLIFLLAKKKMIAITFIIIAMMMGIGVFGYSQVFAATFAGQNNIYTVNFSEEEYGVDDVVTFTLGFFDKNTFSKSTDSSVSVSVDGGVFNEVVSALDTAEAYQVAVGKLPVGNHEIRLRGITAARFNIATFGFSKFGQNNDDLVFTVVVSNEACTDTEWMPSVGDKCEDVVFEQTRCSSTRNVSGTLECPEDFCIDNPTEPRCIEVNDDFCVLYPADPRCIDGSNYCTKYPTAPTCFLCEVSSITPHASTVCSGVQFVQNTNCPDINYVATGTNTTNSECVQCIVNEASWAVPTSAYCAGDQFTQTSNCGSTRTAIGSDPSPLCTPIQNVPLECAVNLQSPWFLCDSKMITLATGYSPLYIRPQADEDKVTNWLFQDADGGINATYKEGQNGLEDIISTMNPTGNGIFGTNKFYDLDVRAVGATTEYTTIKLKFINPIAVEI